MPLSFLPSLLLLLFLSISLLRRIRESGKIVIRFFDGFGWKEKTHYFVFFFSFLRRLVWTNLWTVLEKFLFASGIASNDYWSVTKGTRVSTSLVFFFSLFAWFMRTREPSYKKKVAIRFRDWQQLASLGDTQQSYIHVRPMHEPISLVPFLSFLFFLSLFFFC